MEGHVPFGEYIMNIRLWLCSDDDQNILQENISSLIRNKYIVIITI